MNTTALVDALWRCIESLAKYLQILVLTNHSIWFSTAFEYLRCSIYFNAANCIQWVIQYILIVLRQHGICMNRRTILAVYRAGVMWLSLFSHIALAICNNGARLMFNKPSNVINKSSQWKAVNSGQRLSCKYWHGYRAQQWPAMRHICRPTKDASLRLDLIARDANRCSVKTPW